MARTSGSKLTIDVHPALHDWPELAELAEKGHVIRRIESDADLTLGPTCWRMQAELRRYLADAVKAAGKAAHAGDQ